MMKRALEVLRAGGMAKALLTAAAIFVLFLDVVIIAGLVK